MILSDKDIRARIAGGSFKVEAPKSIDVDSNVHASSIDLHLGNIFKVYEHSQNAILDPMKSDSFANIMRTVDVDFGKPFIVQSGEFILGVTMEKVCVPADLVVRVEGRSSLGRLGIIVHSTAGFVDPGFEGTITLEISNLNRMPVALYPGMRICQIALESMTSPAEELYSSKPGAKYQGQVLPEESRIMADGEFEALAKITTHKLPSEVSK